MFFLDENMENIVLQDLPSASQSDTPSLQETVSFENTSFDDRVYNTQHSDEENFIGESTSSDDNLTDEGSVEYHTDELDISEHENLLDDKSNENKSIMFETSGLTVSDVMAMIMAICVRFNLSYEVRKAIVELIKYLAGPRYKTWSMSKYKFKKECDPLESVLTYTFF